ncbi:MAG: hypothetical protein KIT02_02740 [Devosia sp.]|uniref:sensor histidine kinase n=1 Tax=Devosia sp. TaxID=1871048 RepID=UPI0024C951F5|nr:histidine kinase dimerization/phosphoacceptor domain -containing protein [Devosia sp.]UYO00163.1 MAG: hypothetical protein KIT02_02740 [Devosia sp.]
MAIGLLTLCLATFVVIFTYFVLEAAQQTRNRLEERSRAAVQVVATNAGWIAATAQQTLRRVDSVLGDDMSGGAEALQQTVDSLPAGVDVYIIDKNADTIFATIPEASAVNVSDREYFTALKDGALFYTSGLIVSRLTGDNIFVFSRQIRRQGEFAGAIMVSFTDAIMQDFWSSLEMPAGSTVSLIRSDGELMARFPRPDGPLNLADHPLITQYLPKSASGSYFSDSSLVDQMSRVVSYQRVLNTQIIAVAGIATNTTWDGFRHAIFAVLLILAPVVLGLIGGGLWVVRLLRRDAARRDELQSALDTNTLLFREIHHRVKNNLQSVQSLVRMQDMPRGAKLDLQSRLGAMAAVHQYIYRHDSYADIDAHDLIPVVADEVAHAYGAEIGLDFDIDHVAVDHDHVTPLSLLLSELITNALKYAFADGRSGRIAIGLDDQGQGRARLTVSDNGVGMGEQPETPASMGMRLIRGVVHQMGGNYAFTSDGGTRFEADLALTNAGHAVEPTNDQT